MITQAQTTNELIHNFLYMDNVFSPSSLYITSKRIDVEEIEVETTDYETDWNKLMLIVDKIESIGLVVEIKGISVEIKTLLSGDILFSRVCGDRTQKNNILYYICIQFINWLNNQYC